MSGAGAVASGCEGAGADGGVVVWGAVAVCVCASIGGVGGADWSAGGNAGGRD